VVGDDLWWMCGIVKKMGVLMNKCISRMKRETYTCTKIRYTSS
jgi:hypothetical protein